MEYFSNTFKLTKMSPSTLITSLVKEGTTFASFLFHTSCLYGSRVASKSTAAAFGSLCCLGPTKPAASLLKSHGAAVPRFVTRRRPSLRSLPGSPPLEWRRRHLPFRSPTVRPTAAPAWQSPKLMFLSFAHRACRRKRVNSSRFEGLSAVAWKACGFRNRGGERN